jgi:hypothetical protein
MRTDLSAIGRNIESRIDRLDPPGSDFAVATKEAAIPSAIVEKSNEETGEIAEPLR